MPKAGTNTIETARLVVRDDGVAGSNPATPRPDCINSRTDTTDFPSPVVRSKAKTGRPPKGPRLYLRGEVDGTKSWIIRERNRDLRTGCGESDEDGAQMALEAYLEGKQIPSRSDTIPGYVYFVTCTTSLNYPVKIGWAKNVAARMASMQGANPNLLTVLVAVPGTYKDERTLHARFGHLHIRGEWFRHADELREYIASLPGYAEAYGADEFSPRLIESIKERNADE